MEILKKLRCSIEERTLEKQEYGRLPAGININMKAVEQLRIWDANGETCYPGEKLDQKTVEDAVGMILDRKLCRLAIDFCFQGEGTYVKRLKKTVYTPYQSTMVIHQGSGRYACLYFDGNTKHIHMSIGDMYVYSHVDGKAVKTLQVGDAELKEYAVHKNKKSIYPAICYLLNGTEQSGMALGDSGLWSTENYAYNGGPNTYQKMRRELGLLERV